MAGRKEYEMLFKLNAELGSSYSSAFASAKSPVMGLQTEINKLNRAQADISAYQKQQAAVDNTRKRLEMLKQQYDNIQQEMAETGNSSAAMKNQLIAKQNQIDRTSSSLDQQKQKLDNMGSSLEKAGVNTRNLASESKRLDTEIDELKDSQEQAARATRDMDASMSKAITTLQSMMAALGVTVLLKQFYDGLKASADAAIAFESAMAGVDKTTDLSSRELAAMANEFQRMSTIIPVSANELAGIAETVGQLGIAKEGLGDFTEVMAKLSTATTMTAQEGATMLAQFANITQMDPRNYGRLASAVVDLGNKHATTEQKIIDMSQGMAASASLAGMSEADILGLSAAISSLGIEAQAGSTSASKLITELDKSVKTGKGLQDFGRIAGMTGNDFAKAWGENAAGALARFITGLNDTERHGKSATVILEEMGITEVRLQRMMLSLAGSGDLMNRAIETSNTAWRENTALQAEAEKRYGTTESKVKMAENAFENLKVTLGEHLTPIIGGVAQAFTDVVTSITDWMDKNPELTRAILTMGGILLVGMGAITAYTAVVKLGTAAMGLFTAAIPGIGWVLGGIAALALLGGAFVLLKGHIDKNSESFEKLNEKFDELMISISEQNLTLDLIEEYKQLRSEIDSGTLSAEELAQKQERLAEVKSLLVQRSDGLITATDKETEAFDRQVEALKTIVEMERNQARAAAYENLTKQSKAYTDAIRQEQQSSADLATAQAKQQEVVSIIGDGYESATEKARQLIRSIIDVRNSDFGETDRAKAWDAAAVKEVETLLYTLTGESHDFKANLGNAWYVLENMGKDDTNFRKSWNEANDEVARYQGEVAEAQKVQSEFLQNLVDGFMIGGISMEEYETMLTETFGKYENGAQIVSDIMDEIRSRTELSAEATSALGDNMEDAAAQAQAIEAAAQETKTKIDELAKAYDAAYTSAHSSISGQLKLFEDLKKVDKKDVKSADQMLATLNQQAAYLETYTANLEKAKELGVAKELVSQLSDGSVESATHLQTIVNSSAEKITEINEAFAKVSEGKDTFASTVAEMETDFSSKMADLQQELVTKVSEMNLHAEAAESGKQTIQGLIKGAEGMKAQVAAAYGRVAQAAIDAINAKMKIQSPSKVMEEASMYSVMGLVRGAERNQELYGKAMSDMAQTGIDAYQDIDLLSALGPSAFERDGRIFLMAEQSVVSAQSANQVGTVIQLELAPVYHFEGGARADDVQDVLNKHNDNLRELVLDIVADADIDIRRRSYEP